MVTVHGASYSGLSRTDKNWLDEYLGLVFPMKIEEDQNAFIEKRLLTTGVFSSARVTIKPDQTLQIDVAEKWTTIPVVRGAYGGGTPLRVLGAYDTHAFGRLITLGAESRQYGDAPSGFVAYAKAPRYDGGRYVLSSELWREFRRRTIYDHEGDALGTSAVSDVLGRMRILRSSEAGDPLKIGLTLEAIQESRPSFEAARGRPITAAATKLLGAHDASQQLAVFPTVQYDDILADTLVFDGTRVVARYGAVESELKIFGKGEIEAFTFHVLPHQINLVGHIVCGASALDSLYNQYFLGGLDSIRGFPDGIVHGTHAVWANGEVRYTPESLRFKYLDIQTLGFVDGGGAGESFGEAGRDVRSSAGAGLRFSVPQIYRMMLRFDYALALDGSGARGLSAGFNHFFDPYKPL